MHRHAVQIRHRVVNRRAGCAMDEVQHEEEVPIAPGRGSRRALLVRSGRLGRCDETLAFVQKHNRPRRHSQCLPRQNSIAADAHSTRRK